MPVKALNSEYCNFVRKEEETCHLEVLTHDVLPVGTMIQLNLLLGSDSTQKSWRLRTSTPAPSENQGVRF